MSAGLLVDGGATLLSLPSIVNFSGGGWPCSGAIIGDAVDMLNANTFTNLQVVGGLSQSGQLRVGIQTSDVTTSGSFTDPTSGLASLPTDFASGGFLWINSGGASLVSGVSRFAGFQRPHRYARAIVLSGDFWAAALGVNFVGQLRTTGSGGGFTNSPTSGAVNV